MTVRLIEAGKTRYKLRVRALQKLVDETGYLEAQLNGGIMSNADGTFSPFVHLTTDTMRYARPLAECGIIVIG